MKRGQKLKSPEGRRTMALIERAMRRQTKGATRFVRINVRLSPAECSQFDKLRHLMGMTRSQLLRFVTLKAIALETGVRQRQAREAQATEGAGDNTEERTDEGDGVRYVSRWRSAIPREAGAMGQPGSGVHR